MSWLERTQQDADHDLDSWSDASDVSVDELAHEWMQAKGAERVAVESRRSTEDALYAALRIDETKEGRRTIKDKGFKVVVTTRITRKVDPDLAQEIAAENGLTEHLSSLFRWKPEVDAKAWASADQSITNILAGAITAKPSRPSIAITLEDKE